MNQERFTRVLDELAHEQVSLGSIGEQKEKTLHRTIKAYLGERFSHEIVIGNYIADIARPQEIIEIQTHQLAKLKPKLSKFLPISHVWVVYPVIHQKRIIKISRSNGTLSKPRKSPKTQSLLSAFLELSQIRDLLKNPHLHVKLLLLDVDEYRFESSQKTRNQSDSDLIPTALLEETDLYSVNDYRLFLPFGLDSPFTSDAVRSFFQTTKPISQALLRTLSACGLIERVGKKDRYHLYLIKT